MCLPSARIATRFLRLSSLVVLFALGAVGAKAGNIYTVSNLGDAGTGSAASRLGDLRWCIEQANLDPGSTINFFVSGTIVLQSRLPIITAAMTIDNSLGWAISISGNNANRVFFVDAPGQSVNLSGFTIVNGTADHDRRRHVPRELRRQLRRQRHRQ